MNQDINQNSVAGDKFQSERGIRLWRAVILQALIDISAAPAGKRKSNKNYEQAFNWLFSKNSDFKTSA